MPPRPGPRPLDCGHSPQPSAVVWPRRGSRRHATYGMARCSGCRHRSRISKDDRAWTSSHRTVAGAALRRATGAFVQSVALTPGDVMIVPAGKAGPAIGRPQGRCTEASLAVLCALHKFVVACESRQLSLGGTVRHRCRTGSQPPLAATTGLPRGGASRGLLARD